MGRVCVVCNRLFGCTHGDARHTCDDCRMQDGCGIPRYFTTHRFMREVCPACSGNLVRLKRQYRTWCEASSSQAGLH